MARSLPHRARALITALVLGLTLSACAGTGAFTAPSPGPALWAVQDEDTTVYLFGTIHVLRPETQWRTPHVEAALQRSETLWLELVDVDDQAAAIALLQRYGYAPDGPALSSLLTPDEREGLALAARALGESPQSLEPLQPWLAGVRIGMAAALRAGYDPASGVDIRLKADAEARGTPLRGLETMAQQFRFFHDLPRETQLDFLRQAIETYEESEALLDQMVALWAAGDMRGLDRLLIQDMRRQWPGLYDVLMTQRNADWTDQIMVMMEQPGTVFIAVGAAHLAGPDSVQAMLRQRGLTVRRQ